MLRCQSVSLVTQGEREGEREAGRQAGSSDEKAMRT